MRPLRKCREATSAGADGVVRSTTDNRWLEPTTPAAPTEEASRHFLNGRIHPSFAKEGSFPSVHSHPLWPPYSSDRSNRFKMLTQLMPPNPNEFFIR